MSRRPPSVTDRSAEVVPDIQCACAALGARPVEHLVLTALTGPTASAVTGQVAAACHRTRVQITAESTSVACD